MGKEKAAAEKKKEEEKAVAVRTAPPPPVVGKVKGGIVPRDINELWRMAKLMADSGMMPKGCVKPESVAVAIQMGMEIGLAPMQAVQNIAVINGRPSIWGDAALGLVEASGLLEDFSEECMSDKAGKCVGYKCRAKRVGRNTIIEHEFNETDAKRAELLGKAGPWKTYPKRMYQMRARSWVLRDGFADVLKGLRLAEEQRDIIETEARIVADRDGADALAAGRHDMSAPKAIEAPESAPEAQEEPPQGEALPETPAFDRGAAIREIKVYSDVDANWDSFVAACKSLAINPHAFEKAEDGNLEALLGKVLDTKAAKE